MNNNYQVCTRCIMDTTDPNILFDEYGICNHCKAYDAVTAKAAVEDKYNLQKLDIIINKIKKKGGNKEYDCIIGISGGIDSSYAAYKAVELGLRPLAVHCDTGWDSELAVNNIENILKKLGIDLFTHVIDWEEMRDLQLSFFKSSTSHSDIPQDQAIHAVLYKVADKNKIKYIISGGNISTESIYPTSWLYNRIDLRHLKSIQKKFGRMKLRNYPQLGFLKWYFYYPFIKGIQTIRILNYITYRKEDAKEFLKKELGWRDYGGKHYESVLTRFHQYYYLRRKFGYDERRPYLSSLIVSGQMTREEALEEIENDPYPEEKVKEDRSFVIKKLGITEDEFEDIMQLPKKTFRDYPSQYWMFQAKSKIVQMLRGMGVSIYHDK